MYALFLKLLKDYGVKTSDVAKATGIPQSTFSDWKKGRSKPKAEKIQKIADYFKIDPSYFSTGEKKYVFSIDADKVNKALDKAVAEKYGEEYTIDGLQKQLEKLIEDEISEQREYYTNPATAKIAQEIFDDPDLHALFDAARDSKPEDMKMAADLLRRLKGTNPDG